MLEEVESKGLRLSVPSMTQLFQERKLCTRWHVASDSERCRPLKNVVGQMWPCAYARVLADSFDILDTSCQIGACPFSLEELT